MGFSISGVQGSTATCKIHHPHLFSLRESFCPDGSATYCTIGSHIWKKLLKPSMEPVLFCHL